MGTLFALSLVASLATASADLKSEIQARYDTIAKLLRKEDIKSLEALHAKGYNELDFTGSKTTEKTFAGNMAQTFRMLDLKVVKIKVNRATLKKGAAIAEVSMVVQAFGRAPDVIDVNSTSRDTWVKDRGVWKLRDGRTLTRTTKINGKVVPEKRG